MVGGPDGAGGNLLGRMDLIQLVVETEEACLGQISAMGMAEPGLMLSVMTEMDLDGVGYCLDVLDDNLWVWCHGVASCAGTHALAQRSWRPTAEPSKGLPGCR